MVPMQTSQDNSTSNNDRIKFSNLEAVSTFSKVNKLTEECDEECLNDQKEVSKRIDCKAEVHVNDSDSSYANLSMLFKLPSSDEEDKRAEPKDDVEKESYFQPQQQHSGAKDLVKSVSNKSSLDIVSNSDTSLSNITSIYTKANLSHNSIGTFDNLKYDKMSTFRRARSELETLKHSDNSRYSRPTLLVPPSHPVSMEIINAKNYAKENDETTALDSSRFNKQESSNVKLNPFEVLPDYRFNTKMLNLAQVAPTSKDSLEVGGSFNLEKIEECQEKNPPQPGPSATYIRACEDSSEDGDESEISLCNNESKLKSLNRSKQSKLPLRKARFTSSRKRSSKAASSASSRSAHPEWCHKHDIDPQTRRDSRGKQSIVLMSTSEEDDDNHDAFQRIRSLNDRFDSLSSSDSSSIIPSSSASSSSMLYGSRKASKTVDDYEAAESLANLPSTSTGVRSSLYTLKKHKSKSSKHSHRRHLSASDRKFLLNEFTKLNGAVPGSHLKHIMSAYCSQMMLKNSDPVLTTLFDACQPLSKQSLDYAFVKQLLSSDSTPAYNYTRERHSSKSSFVGVPNFFAEVIASPGTHIAESHEDTTVGAVHVFQDERGNWFSYTFDENSTGTAKGISSLNPFPKVSGEEEVNKYKSSALVPSNSLFYLNNTSQLSPPDPSTIVSTNPNGSTSITGNEHGKENMVKLEIPLMSPFGGHTLHTPDSLNSNSRNVFFDSMPMYDSIPSYMLDASATSGFLSLTNHSNHSYARSQQQLKQSQYYEMNVLNLKTIKIRFDRLSLQAFLDRNLTTCELIFSILLAILVAIFSSILLHKSFFHDISLAWFCLVVASSQYTLLKSVQPDAASPTHGFNRITIYSRPIYFCIGSLILLLSHEYLNNHHNINITLEIYGVNFLNRDFISIIFTVSRTFLLAFPGLFLFGFLPQFNTFLMYIFEQVDIHIFGGTASTMGMVSATYSLLRSIATVTLLYLLGQVLNIKETHIASFSVFCGCLFAISYHMSRLPSDPMLYWNVICSGFAQIGKVFKRLTPNSGSASLPANATVGETTKEPQKSAAEGLTDPLPEKLKQITLTRLESDFIVCVFIAIGVFGVHVSSIFKLQPFVSTYTTWLAIYWGFVHYMMCNCRKQLPWQCFASPILKSHEYNRFEVKEPAKNMWFEKMQAWMWFIEKNIVSPLFFLSIITNDCPLLIKNYGTDFGIFLLVLCAFKGIRSTFNDPSHNYIIITFTYLLFTYDFKEINRAKDNIFLLNLFLVSIVYYKITDFLLKLRFVITYVAPWQITWGSAFHAFAQPFSVPHSAMLLVQIFISSVLSSPLQPFLGSAIFLTSYVRPIKFWERDYNTKRVDHSNTRLASQIDKAQIGSDDNNLNSIFYEHLTRSLQNSLYGDLILGRWGDVSQGDFFVLASDNLNCLVHIIELGNGMVTFQVRGLEFRGTYCQQREVEAISESVSDDEGCCCCEPGRLWNLLSVNSAFNQRWLSWEVTHTNYVLEGYSISENSASTILTPYDLRKALITYYVKTIIYYCVNSKSFIKWLSNEDLKDAIQYLSDPAFVDLDPTFNINIDEDFDPAAAGITRVSFKLIYKDWIMYCIEHNSDLARTEYIRKNEDFVISLCMGLSLLARRALGSAAHNNSALMSVDFFLYGFHSLFKGDLRVHSSRDEWVFHDMDFLNKVIVPSVRMSLKLHQDQFTTYEEYESNAALYEAISTYQKTIVISHEADPVWRNAILSNVSSLLALRHVLDDGTDQYKVVMLNKRYLNFRVIKINRECVRGLWAGQQQELIFLRNRNPERGSIQNAKQVLRNIINSSCDQPIGYPIFVSGLYTSFAETSDSLNSIIGPPLSLSMFKRAICGFFSKNPKSLHRSVLKQWK